MRTQDVIHYSWGAERKGLGLFTAASVMAALVLLVFILMVVLPRF